MSGIGCVENEVELEFPVFSPLILGSENEFLRSQLQSIIFLARGMRENIDLCS